MSLLHKVIILNKPLKIRGFTLMQWSLMVAAAGLAFALGSYVPREWKIGNLPAGFLVGLIVFSGVLVFVNASEMKPGIWWRNQFLYRLGLMPTIFLPHPEEGQSHRDITIVDKSKKDDEFYVR